MNPLAEPEQRHFRAVLGHFATGVAVVSALYRGTPVGITIQSFCALSLDPPLILLCPAITSTSWPKIAEIGQLCVNLLAEGQADVARQFARSGGDKYVGIGWTASAVTGSPKLDGALAWIDCRIENHYPGGDHLIVTCRVLDLAAQTDLRPLVFFQSGFQRTV
jgi:flavin reductase (DIM6/NTAB) family NADH-FMN oxidoreductase RutF